MFRLRHHPQFNSIQSSGCYAEYNVTSTSQIERKSIQNIVSEEVDFSSEMKGSEKSEFV